MLIANRFRRVALVRLDNLIFSIILSIKKHGINNSYFPIHGLNNFFVYRGKNTNDDSSNVSVLNGKVITDERNTVRDVIIIGSGPSGCTAAIYTARALLRPLLLAGYNSGGQLMLTSDVENFPGYRTPVTGTFIALTKN